MARTFNRQPMQVGYPSKKNVKDYFFNHYEWKGVNDDKNFLEVDQHTFNDAMNVYMDSESLLRSRPSLKRVPSNLYNSSGSTVIASLQNILDFWVFGDYIVYYCQNITVNGTSYSYVLLFTKKIDNKTHVLAVSEDLSTLSADFVSSEIKLILSKRKIFVFTKYSLSYFDFDTETYYNSADASYVNPIYIPTTKIITSTTTTDIESPNILTNKEFYTYLYDSVTGVSVDIYGKEVSFKIGNNEYTVTFTENTRNVIAQLYFSIDESYGSALYPNIAVSSNGVIAMFSTSTRYLALTYDNGKSFQYFLLNDTAGEVYGNVSFSRSGDIVYLCTATGVWVLSVYSTDASGTKKYPELFNYTASYSVPSSYFTTGEDYITVDMIQDGELVLCYCDMSGNYNMYFIDESESTKLKHFNGSGLAWYNYTHWVNGCKYYNNVDCSYTYNGSTVNTQRLLIINSLGGIILVRVNWNNISQSCIQCLDIYANGYVDGIGFGATFLNGTTLRIVREYSGIDTSWFSSYNIVSVALTTADNNIISTHIPPDHTVNKSFTNYRMFFTSYNTLVCDEGIYDILANKTQNFINVDNAFIISVSSGIYYTNSSFFGNNVLDTRYELYSTNITSPIEMKYETVTKYDNGQPVYYNFIAPDHYAELHNFYFAINNAVMISNDKTDEDGNWQWYLPDNQKQNFNYHITGLHPISDDVIAVFMKDEIDYIMYDTNAKAYTYQKSKLQVGLPEGNNVITSLDGTTILFVTKRGLVGLGYQDFIASTEQALSYLSDSIFQWFNDWNTSAIRLHLHGFWLICYKQTTGDVWVYDIRNKSWWPCEYKNHISMKFATDGTELLCLASNTLFDFDRSDNNYYDIDGVKQQNINWHIVSQKLYLNAANYYKHIVNITLGIALDTIATNNQAAPTMNLQVCNYRKIRNVVNTENFNYNVDMIRTLVHRLNYFKVCEFQYKLSSDDNNVLQVPLSLANITVKYKIAGEVR